MATDPLDQLRAALPSNIQVTGYLDRGGQGAVFKGIFCGEDAAIKIFDPTPADDPRRVERELSILQSIDCPNLVRVLHKDEISINNVDYPLVVYEYLSGGDLRRFLEPSYQQLSPATIALIGLQIGNAAQELWARRCVHRDIKPANIVQDSDGRFVLVDVGFARHVDLSNITAVGIAIGTDGYKSPEQARGRRKLTIHSDAFSLGITLFELTAREHPFNYNQHLIGVQTPPSLSSKRPDLPESLPRLVHKMLSVVPSRRPSNLRERFEKILEDC